MEERNFKLLVVLIAIIGNILSLGVLIWQAIVNMFGFWMWFSFLASIGWGLLVGLMLDMEFLK